MFLILSEQRLELGVLAPNVIKTFQVTVKNISDYDITPTVQASCGCTTPDLDPKTIPANGEATLNGIFDTIGRSGLQHKNVRLTYVVEGKTYTEKLDFFATVED